MKLVSRLAFLVAGLTCGLTSVNAQQSAATPASAEKKQVQKAAKKAARKKPAPAASMIEKAPNVDELHPVSYDCDLGDSLTLYKKPDDDRSIALRWNKRTHQLSRVPTTTGAERYENPKNGWVWIGIPAKGMLLDSKLGRQLANECRNDEQKKLVVKK